VYQQAEDIIMRLTRKAVLGGIASFAVAGAALAAEAPHMHSMRIGLPGGGSATIHYTGDVAPRVVVGRARAAAAAPLAFDVAPFAAMARIMAEMDRRAAALMVLGPHQAGGPGLNWVSLPGFAPLAAGAVPPGAVGYSYVSEVSGDGNCVRSMEVTRAAPDAKPKVVRHVSGDCADTGAKGPAAPTAGDSAQEAAKPVKPAGPPLRETI
jgi:hypothetical protein